MDLKYIELALFCFILLPSLGRCIRNKQDCDYDTKLLGCPCGNPLGSKRYMTKDEEYGCFTCKKGQYYENIFTMQCQLCGGLTSCKENVSPNACDQKYCEGDEPTTTSKMVITTTTSATTVSHSPITTSNNDVSDVINTTPGSKDSYTTESVTRQSTEYHTFKAKEGFRNEDSSIEDSEEKKAPVPGGTNGLTTGAIIAIVVLLLGVIAIFKYRKYRNKKMQKSYNLIVQLPCK